MNFYRIKKPLPNIVWVKFAYYNDTSYGGKSPSTWLVYMLPNGKIVDETLYGKGYLSEEEVTAYLEIKVKPKKFLFWTWY